MGHSCKNLGTMALSDLIVFVLAGLYKLKQILYTEQSAGKRPAGTS